MFLPLAARRAGSFLSQILFSRATYSGPGSAACVEKCCPLTLTFDKIIHTMFSHWKLSVEWSHDQDWLFVLPADRVILAEWDRVVYSRLHKWPFGCRVTPLSGRHMLVSGNLILRRPLRDEFLLFCGTHSIYLHYLWLYCAILGALSQEALLFDKTLLFGGFLPQCNGM